MAGKTRKSVLAGFDVSKEVQAHAKDETKYGIINLPPGIRDGVAKLQECYFGIYEKGDNKGKPYLRASGVVLEPESVGSTRVAGLHTSVMFAMCETGKGDKLRTKDTNVADALNALRQLAGEGATANLKDGSGLEALAAAIEKAAPYFRFSTSPRVAQSDNGSVKKGDVTGVWENWHGTKGLENYTPSLNGQATKTVDKSGEVSQSATSDSGEYQGEYREGSDLDSLGERADGGDTDAIDSLKAMARDKGFTDEEILETDTWTDLVGLIKVGKKEEPSKEEEKKDGESESWEPVEKGVYHYAPPGKKPGTKGKPVEVKVLKVHTDNEYNDLVDIVTTDKNKTKFKDVPWTDLIVE